MVSSFLKRHDLFKYVTQSKIFHTLMYPVNSLLLIFAIFSLLQSLRRGFHWLNYGLISTNSTVSTWTIYQWLLEIGIRKWKVVGCTLLVKKQVEEQLKWALEHRHWTKEDWKRIAWFDECAIKKDSDCHELAAGHRLRAGLERSERAEARGSGGNRVSVGPKGRRLS